MRKKQTPNYKKILLIFIAVILTLLTLLFVLEKTHTTNFFHKNSASNMPSGLNAEEKKAEDLVNSQTKQNAIENKDSSSSSTSKLPQESNISLDVRRENNDSVTVVTKLTGYSAGICELHITNGQQSTTLKADVIYQAEFSTCAGYSVPVSSLGKGTWQITLTVTHSGQTAEKKTTFEVK